MIGLESVKDIAMYDFVCSRGLGSTAVKLVEMSGEENVPEL